MTTQSLLFEQKRIRQSKRQKIYGLFTQNLGRRFSSRQIHEWYGTAARTRISEINRDPAAEITIHNRVTVQDGQEQSVYWSERKRA